MLSKKDPDIIKTYLEDSSNLKGGYAEEVLIPENIEELSAILKEANIVGRPVTISGGGTGTTGSRIPFGGVVVSLEKFNEILNISKERMSAVLKAGVIVDDLKDAADKEGMFYTCHPTEGTAFVGGTIATNASGARSFKYGPTRDYVKRLKMVLADGSIVDLRRGEIRLSRESSKVSLPSGAELCVPLPAYRMPRVKNAAGYFAEDGMDLIDLFIGQEGTLSVIVEAELGLVKKPSKMFSSFIFFDSREGAWNFAVEARDLSKANRTRPDTSAIDALSIEYLDRNSLLFLRERNADIPEGVECAVFIEQETIPGRDEDRILNGWLGLINKHGVSLDDTWVAMNEEEGRTFTSFRHAVPEAVNDSIRRSGYRKISTDIAVRDSALIEMMETYTRALTDVKIAHLIFGHIGENHLHVNLLPASDEELAIATDTALAFVKKGVSLGGTVSAEHGIGKIKHKYLEMMYGTSGLAEMSKIKRSLDPNCILGLDNIFPRQLLYYQKI